MLKPFVGYVNTKNISDYRGCLQISPDILMVVNQAGPLKFEVLRHTIILNSYGVGQS